jgi:hypothetical protein
MGAPVYASELPARFRLNGTRWGCTLQSSYELVSCRYDMTLSGIWHLQSRYLWPYVLRRESAAACLLVLPVGIPPEDMDVCL